MVSIGDLKNNLRILQSEAHQMKYNEEFDLEGLAKGNPQCLLPLYHHIFANWNAQFTEEVMNVLGEGLSMKSDVRFMECIYKILRDMFHFKPSMTKEQFFTLNNFAERKILMCIEVMRMVRDRCRFMGPKNPTNPNIKVSSVVDTGRHSKKTSAHELVTSEPSAGVKNPEIKDPVDEMIQNKEGLPLNIGDQMNRKVVEKGRLPMSALMGMNEKDGWQLKLGYLRPKSAVDGKEEPVRKTSRERSGKTAKEDVSEPAPKEVAPLPPSKEEKPGAARTASPPLANTRKGKGAEVVNMSPSKRPTESGHIRVVDVLEKSPGQSNSDWDPSEAVECILAKVRDLPLQLTSFMKAVEGRLYKIEGRLDIVEAATARITHMEGREAVSSEMKHGLDTLQARLLLLENRVTLNESKASKPVLSEHPKMASVTEDRRTEVPASPFVSLERGDNLFSGSITSTFSPIRQDFNDFNPINDTIGSIVDADNRRHSTPNQSASGVSRLKETEKGAEGNADTTICENLDSSTQQQVDRIKELFKATQLMLPVSSTETSVDG